VKSSKKPRIVVYGVLTLLVLLYIFDSAPNLNPLYPDGAFFWCAAISLYVVAWAFFYLGGKLGNLFMLEGGRVHVNIEDFRFRAFPRWVKLLLALLWGLFLVVTIYSTVFFHWQTYRDQLGQPEVQVFSSNIQAVDLSKVPIVDYPLALKLADKKLGERPSLGSQVRLGNPTIQMVDERLLWVVPLHHSGFFKWITNLEGSAGYITVSATNVNDVEYYENYKIKYQPDSYLLHDLKRWTRFTAAPLSGIVDYSFEIDDSGVPHWIVSTYHNLRGFALPEATGVVVMNASTGQSARYRIGETPPWVDRVQPEAFILNQINNQGEYVHGFLNFSDKDKYKSSDGHAIVYNFGRCYLFTGLTSVGSDESSIGFMMVDMVTKQPLLYQLNGATEYSAQNSAQGKVQHLGYYASFPLIINAESTPTYFMTLKDREGLVKQYALVSVSNYSIVGVGDTITQAYRDYQTALRQGGQGFDSLVPGSGERTTVTGSVNRIGSRFDGSQTIYYLVLDEHPDKIFTAEGDLSSKLPLTRDGDRVSIVCTLFEGNPIVQVESFDNPAIGQ
jgi:hypothetical protein